MCSVLGALLALALAACGSPDAMLVLRLPLPPEDSTSFARMEVAPAGTAFREDWSGDQPIGARGFAEQAVCVRTSRPGELALSVKTLSCGSTDCSSPGDADAPELWYSIPYPFYEGHVTWVMLEAPREGDATATAPLELQRCDVWGCQTPEMFACTTDGRHACQLDDAEPETIEIDDCDHVMEL